VATILALSSEEASYVLPALTLLSHRVRTIPAEPASLVSAPDSDVVLVDARSDLAAAKALCRILTTTGLSAALLVVVNESGMPALTAEWGFDDAVLTSAGPGEVDARIRLLTTRESAVGNDHMISASGVTIDEVSYQAKANGRILDLTFKEFELLRFLAGHPQRVFTREQLLSEVWGVRLLRRNPHRRRPRQATSRKTWRHGVPHWNRAQRGLPLHCRGGLRRGQKTWRVPPSKSAAAVLVLNLLFPQQRVSSA